MGTARWTPATRCRWATPCRPLRPHGTPSGRRTQPEQRSRSSGLTITPRAAQHSLAVGAGDDARVRHPDEQPMLDYADGDLERCRQGLRISDAAFEREVKDQVAVV